MLRAGDAYSECLTGGNCNHRGGYSRAGRERGGNEKDTELSAEQLQHPKTGRVESSQSKWRDRGENAASRDPERHGVPAA